MQDDARCTQNGEALLDVSGASPYALVCRSACVLQAGSDDGQRVHVRGADADGLAEHVAVLQRPLVAHDALKLVRSMALENHGECGCAGSLLDKVT